MPQVLCEKCFPNWRDREINTIVPLLPCEKCGAYDDRKNGGPICHRFPLIQMAINEPPKARDENAL